MGEQNLCVVEGPAQYNNLEQKATHTQAGENESSYFGNSLQRKNLRFGPHIDERIYP